MLNPREEKKQKKKKPSETAIKSLEELSRVMRCRQSIPSFHPHVKSAPPPITCASSILSTMKESTETSLYSYIWREKKMTRCAFFMLSITDIYIAEVNV